jgi:hypothetical protein
MRTRRMLSTFCVMRRASALSTIRIRELSRNRYARREAFERKKTDTKREVQRLFILRKSVNSNELYRYDRFVRRGLISAESDICLMRAVVHIPGLAVDKFSGGSGISCI